MPESLMTSKEVATQLRVSPSTLSRWRDVKRGPDHVNLAGIIRYRAEDVEEFLKVNRG